MKLRNSLRVLAVQDLDQEALGRAASGGAFSVLARPVIDAGGFVFGASMADGGIVRHTVARTYGELESLQGSCYVQSDMSNIYPAVADAVRSGALTMFVGTPCQCAAMISYLETKRIISSLEECDGLIICDLVCHGAPNGELFRAHQSWLSRKVHADDGIHGFKFRSKRRGWGLYYYYYYYRKGKMHEVCEPGDYDPYYAAFLRGDIYRECCYSCPFAKSERVSDFTIGDYWGIEQVHPEFYSKEGISLLMINTQKGQSYFEHQASLGCRHIESNLSLAVQQNHNLNMPSRRPETRDEILRLIMRRRVDGNLDDLFDVDLKPKLSIKSLLKRYLPAGVYSFLKSLLKRR